MSRGVERMSLHLLEYDYGAFLVSKMRIIIMHKKILVAYEISIYICHSYIMHFCVRINIMAFEIHHSDGVLV